MADHINITFVEKYIYFFSKIFPQLFVQQETKILEVFKLWVVIGDVYLFSIGPLLHETKFSVESSITCLYVIKQLSFAVL